MDQCYRKMERLAYSAIAGEVPVEVLKERPGDCRVLRVQGDSSESLVLKIWRRPGWRGVLRRITKSTPGHKEFRGLSTLRKIGVKAPEPLLLIRLSDTVYNEALFEEDVGDCVTAVQHVKSLIASGLEDDLNIFLGEIVEMTALMIMAKLVDVDHTFMNIVATGKGSAVRLDAELAGRARRGSSEQMIAEMLGKLIGTYMYAVQPDTERTTQFCQKLFGELQLKPSILFAVARKVDAMIEIERKKHGIQNQVSYPWQ